MKLISFGGGAKVVLNVLPESEASVAFRGGAYEKACVCKRERERERESVCVRERLQSSGYRMGRADFTHSYCGMVSLVRAPFFYLSEL